MVRKVDLFSFGVIGWVYGLTHILNSLRSQFKRKKRTVIIATGESE
jgi:hypothetical protein